MKPRSAPLGDKNVVGATVSELRKIHQMSQKDLATKMQLEGVNINLSALSKLEGQTRLCTDMEVYVIAKVFHITVDELMNKCEF